MTDKEYYAAIADELENDTVDRALWTQALAQSSGNPEATKSLYINLRFLDLKKAAAAGSTQGYSLQIIAESEPENAVTNAQSEAPGYGVVGIDEIRADLAKELIEKKKSSLYQTLGVSPDASDEVIAAAIAELEKSIAEGGSSLSTELKFAKETLQDPYLRQEYDRKLLKSLVPPPPMIMQFHEPELRPEPESVKDMPQLVQHLWGSRNTSIIIGIAAFLLVGYLLLAFAKGAYQREIEKAQITTVQQAVEAAKEAEAARIENEKFVHERQLEMSESAAERSAQFQSKEMSIREDAEDRRAQEQVNDDIRANQQLKMQKDEQARREARERQRQEMAQQERDDQIARREQRYWSCMNLKLNDHTEAEATLLCSEYRN